MRQFPVVKSGMAHFRKNRKVRDKNIVAESFILAAGIALAPLLFSTSSFAQVYASGAPPMAPAVPQPAYSYAPVQSGPPLYTGAGIYNPAGAQPAGQQPTQAQQAVMQQQPPSSTANSRATSAPATQQSNLGSLTDPSSPAYKANQLGIEAEQQRSLDTTLDQQGVADADIEQQTPPPDVQNLQQINKYQSALGSSLADDPVTKGLGLDMRKAAQKEAALSYGARGGLAKSNFQIMERMKGFETVLDRVFNFRALLIKAPSGLLIEPPIIKESVNAVVVTSNGDEAAVADKVFDINKKAKIVTAPRDWRQYLVQSWSQVPPPPRVLWPKTPKEQADWNTWVAQGWEAGTEQAEQIFEANVNHLVADYNGMVRYKMLLAQDMISAPYAMHEDRGVQANANQMRVGDRAVRITGPSQFLTKADLWKPADQ